MGTHTQRKRFATAFEANEQAAGFHDPAFHVPGVVSKTAVVEGDEGFWLYLTQEGDIVGDDALILPDYDKVDL